ncbi:MAG TPA: lipocalin family protein [Deltaproteobacteria bacterium]|nr:lipocalin family protein [Deltaproteobacteria bacterium]HQJ07695.1 lipocalin family protein [Deltaproteobacteria bacterium]
MNVFMKYLPVSLAILFLVFLAFLLSSCTGIPKGVQPVENFDIARYAGKWYEIARLDHRFEKGLSNTSATYTLRTDGGIDVLNRGYDRKKSVWKEASGKGYFAGDRAVGCLKVSFFPPFYASYNVIALDREDYSYAMVCGPNRGYLWILSRTPSLDRKVVDDLVRYAADKGFPVSELGFPEQDMP